MQLIIIQIHCVSKNGHCSCALMKIEDAMQCSYYESTSYQTQVSNKSRNEVNEKDGK